MKIVGLQKTSVIDYNPYVSCVIFLAGCNFRCGFCHNPDLVFGVETDGGYSVGEIIEFLEKRKIWLDAVCITGGEPTINPELVNFIRDIKFLDYKVKLDSNGTNPKMLRLLVEQGLVDYIAMDIKTNIDDYSVVTNSYVDVQNISESVGIIMASGVDYEFRTTVVPGLHKESDFVQIGKWLVGARLIVLQQFRPTVCLNKKFEKVSPFSIAQLEAFKDVLSNYIKDVQVR
ncbi:anaerobic ribonucleoside-triphosphate reductase activating protein [bacterium]|jgi:pyruvate formate lyase activating enzyme|nr:anaerobic ribonucleoside-triphosphate reductase activating protein [bacterium]